MLKKEQIQKMTSYAISLRGEKIAHEGYVYNMHIDRQPNFTILEAEVGSQSNYTQVYETRAVISADEQWLLDESCNCPYYESSLTPCKHIAAVLTAYAELDETGIDAVSIRHEVKSHPAALEFLNDMEEIDEPENEGSGRIIIYPIAGGCGDKPNSLSVEFKVGIPGGSFYVIRNIKDFCDRIRNHEFYKYGKKLEFAHSRTAFRKEVLPLIDFLMSVTSNLDSFKTSARSYFSTWYYEDTGSVGRSLSLRGSYLDSLFEALLPFQQFVKETGISLPDILEEVTDREFKPEISLNKTENGLLFTGSEITYAEGQNSLYILERYNRAIRVDRDPVLIKILDLCELSSQKQNILFSEKDLPSFVTNAWPSLTQKCTVRNTGFLPENYAPARPYFEIYLDMPDQHTIDARIEAVYPDARYEMCTSEKQNASQRDIRFEKKIMDSILTWFESRSPYDNRPIITSEDKIYHFMSEGIPFLQERAEVFISDKLKHLKIKKTGGVSLGVSTGVDLLQLELFSTDLSRSEIIEILNRYTPKKKFYRLKNGTLIQTDEQFEELYEMKENMNISAKDLVEGKASLPLYRAMYINQLSEKVSMEMAKDNSFDALIRKIRSISDREYDLPEGLTVTLRPYQAEGFRWLSALKDNGFGGLLADEMGLGKTLQVIALMGSSLRKGKCLVVCPASLVYNWASEIHRFMPSMKARIISGTAEERKELIHQSTDDEVLITSYDLLKRDIEEYEGMKFDIEVIDEAQYIKNAGTNASRSVKAIQSSFRIALTGTPIENRLSELWSIFDYILPGFFSNYTHFRKQYEIPIVRDQDDLVHRDLTSMITPFILRRLKKDVLKDLPDKLEQVYYAKLEDEQKKLYDSRVEMLKASLEKQTDSEFSENKIAILAELTRLRQLCCEPSLLYEGYKGNSAKKEMCIDMIQEAVDAGHKILLFSQFATMLDELTKMMDERNIGYYLLKGSTPKQKRAEMVDAFQKDGVPVFCISLKAGGTGLNLTAADIVIHYDPWWNTAVENQATDRAHRIGQKNVVSVYRLIMKDTIEERIIEMQNQKTDLAEGILSGEGISSSSLTKEDLLAIL